ncbi:MAG: hypothetical protein KGS61_03015 [Verrucomicrobia bacterium]|nr:hypothetical protein [Verrucomicrobiota bacterium]
MSPELTSLANEPAAADAARSIRGRLPPGGLFAGQDWRLSPTPFPLAPELASELQTLGRVLLQFNRAVNRLYRQSLAGQQPPWVAAWLDQGKPAGLLELQRATAFKHEVPRVLRPDLLLTDAGFRIVELDAVPGGIGATAWLNETYCALNRQPPTPDPRSSILHLPSPPPVLGGAALGPAKRSEAGPPSSAAILGGPDGMLAGFAGIFGDAARVHIVVSKESATYRPEMVWLAERLNTRPGPRFTVRDDTFETFADGDAVYRFFELFDLPNVPAAARIFELAAAKRIRLTPPPKPVFEEKLLFALLWNRNLRGFWRQELGEGFFERMLKLVPYTWLVDPAPLPPHAALPELGLTDWHQLKALSQRERELILKVSGFSAEAWGARGVYLGSDLSAADWSAAVDTALRRFSASPHILQRYCRPKVVEAAWFDFEQNQLRPMNGRARLCPYYFVAGEGDAARANLSGVLATICPIDKKIIHGMKEAILAPACG